MSWIKTIAHDAADGELEQLYAKVCDPKTGRLDNILQVHALHRRGLAAHYELYRAVMKPTATLRGAEREMIALLVSQINGCHY